MGKTMIGSLNAAKKMFGTVEIIKEVLNGSVVYQKQTSPIPPQPTLGNYIVFSSYNTFTLNVVDNKKYWNGNLYYSVDTLNWNTWDGTTTLNSSQDNSIKYLYLRGQGNVYITGENGYDGTTGNARASWVLTGSNIRCDGDIQNLLNYEAIANGNQPGMSDYCYRYLFRDCTNLVVAPSLLANSLSICCYEGLFNGCSGLITAPSLPATTMKGSCYYKMFQNCTALTSTPSLLATTLAKYCYSYMFSGCTSLTTITTLPATNLAEKCYSYMFSGCKSLITPSNLPATTLAIDCYTYMFNGCIAMQSLPVISATNITYNQSLRSMFNNCIYLQTDNAILDLSNATSITGQNCMTDIGIGFKVSPNLASLSNNYITATINQRTYNIYYDFDDNDTIQFDTSNVVIAGTSKYTLTYNIYTDNTTIKDVALTKVDSYTTVNVYHLDGSAW